MRRLAKLVSVLAIFGTVTAVAAPDPMPAAPVPAGADAAPVKPVKPSMTAAEMNIAVAQMEVRLEDAGQQMGHLQEIAKKQKDVIKLNCVNDKLVESKAQRNIADEIHTQLVAAIEKNSADREALYQQYLNTSQSINDLREQAKACVGEAELHKQESGVTVEAPPTPDDPTVMNPPSEQFEPPAYASPFD